MVHNTIARSFTIVTVYTTGPACFKCNTTKAALTKGGVPYEEILLADAPEQYAEFEAKGYLVAPIVVHDEGEWSDFRIDQIRALIKQHATVAA